MENIESERLLNEIASLLAKDLEYPLDRTLLYAEVASNMVGSSVFKETGNAIIYRFSDELGDVLLDLWNKQKSDPAWCAIEYYIHGSRFEVKYTYPDDPEWDGECDLDYRQKVVARYYGDKPVIYPPMPRGQPGLTFKL